MTLFLHPDHIHAIHAHAGTTYPEECCGMLLGVIDQEHPDARQVVEVLSVQNAWTLEHTERLMSINTPMSRANRYWIDPKEMLVVQRQARDRQLRIIGIYHSHPDHPAIPSECDRALAWSGYSYLIVSVLQGIPQDLLSWRLDDCHQFQPEAIISL